MNEDNQSTSVLVTGASGYIAMHCVLQLLQEGYRVRGTLRTPSREKNLRQAFARHIDADGRLEFVTADLMSDEGWADAAANCRYILHVASPNPPYLPKDEDELIIPARDGTLRVLRAAANAGVQRVVLTSSIAAIIGGHDADERVFSEEAWANTDGEITAYSKSKTFAERAAWDFVKNSPDGQKLELVVINPSYVLGPFLDEDIPLSVEIVGKLMRRDAPGSARIHLPMVDVRDVATAHLLAMTSRQAVGMRFICSVESYWMQEVAIILDKHFAGRGYRIPTRQLPDFFVRLFALYDGSVKRILPSLGKKTEVSSDRLRNTLDWQPRPVEEAIVETAESLIDFGL